MNPKFLVVDDDPDILALVEAMLVSMGCEVTCAKSGEEGLALLSTEEKSNQFDALFLDVMMPGLNGYQVLEKLREQPHTASFPVVMLTAKTEPGDIIDGYKGGANYYITKPFTKEQLVFGIDLIMSVEEDEGPDAKIKTVTLDGV